MPVSSASSTPAVSSSTALVDHEPSSLWHALSILLPHWKLLLVLMGLAAVTAGTWRLRLPRTWKAETAVVPVATSGGPTALAGMAAQFGLNMQTGDPMQSPALYVESLRSREFLDRLLQANGGDAAVAPRLDIHEIDEARRYEATVRALGRALVVTADPKTNVVRIAALAPDTTFARALAARSLEILQQLGVERRHDRHGAERAFTTQRRRAAEQQLMLSEDALRSFRLSNRSWSTSPRLMTDADRLQRAVAESQALVQGLRQAEEQSRLEELRGTPLFTVVQPVFVSRLPESRRVLLHVVLGVIGTFALTATLLLLRDALRTVRRALASQRRHRPVYPDVGEASRAA